MRTAVTDAAGTYAFSELPLGEWNVTAALTGFSSGIAKGVHVDVSSVRRIDFVLNAGGRSESVDVVARSALVDSTGNTLGGTIDGRQAAELPVNGRDFTKLLEHGAGHGRRPELDQRLARLVRPVQRQRQPRPLQQLPAGRHGHERRLPQPAGDQPGRRFRHALDDPAGGRDRGVPDPVGRRGRVRQERGGDRQHRHALGQQRAARGALRVLPRRGARRAELLQREATGQEPVLQPPVRRLARRAAREGPDLLLPGLRRPARGRRHPGAVPRSRPPRSSPTRSPRTAAA